MHWLDPSILPTVEGRVAQYTINPKGDVDGLILDDDRQIHVPPHLGRAVARLVGAGDRVEARYVKPRGADVFAAVTVTDATGKTVTDSGPPAKHAPAKHAPPKPVATKPMHVAGRVRLTLYAPKGEVAGAVLEGGEQVRVDPKANADLADYFAKDARIEVWGDGFRRLGVTVVDAAEVGFSESA